jgi:predicted RNA-binding protein
MGGSSKGSNYWNLPGSVENWDVGIERRVWGMKPKFAKTWDRLSIGDILFFYVAAPVRGVVGYGHVVAKFKGSDPLWPDEIRAAKVIYPYRFEFEIDNVLDPKKWVSGRVPVKGPGISIQSIGRVRADTASKLLERLQGEWGRPEPPVEDRLLEKKVSRHDMAKELLLDVGRMRRFVCDEEYRIDGERLDVVWKRVERSVPTYAFEVQIGGDIYHAMGKLKHAFDIWNSKIFLVIDQKSLPKVHELLAGTFHEIADHMKVVQLEALERLQDALATVHHLEKELGLE